MNEYLPIIISLVSVFFAVFAGVIAIRRNNRLDDSAEASTMATIIVKLENIDSKISDVKAELTNMKEDMKADHDALIRLQASDKQLWHQVDEIKNHFGMDIPK